MVYIILVNWNGWRDTIECLESVFRLDYPNFSVVVCDNDSNDGSIEHIRSWARGEQVAESSNLALSHLVTPPIPKPIKWVEYDRAEAECGGNLAEDIKLVLIRTGGNLGFAGGNNIGFRYALARGDADYVWALNNDTIITPDSLSKMVEHFANEVGIGLCGSTVCFSSTPNRVQALGGAIYNKWFARVTPLGLGHPVPVDLERFGSEVEQRISYVFGASMLASRKFLTEVGLMQEDYFLFFEELDWAMRARRKGFRLGYAPLSRIYHKAGAASGSSEETAFALYFLNANRLKFVARFYPLLLPVCWLALLYELSKALIKCRGDKIKAISCVLLGIKLYQDPRQSRLLRV